MKKSVKILAVMGLILVVAGSVVFGIFYGTDILKEDSTPESLTTEEIAAGVNVRQTQISLETDHISVTGDGVDVSGTTTIIQKSGTYVLAGTLTNGQICVNAGSDDMVVLDLNGVDISNETEPAVYVENAKETLLLLEDGTDNRHQSGLPAADGALAAGVDENASGGVVYAKDNLSVSGTGSLTVAGYINNGIHSSDNLVLESGNLNITAVNDGIKGKDSVTVTGGTYTITSGGDAVQSDMLLQITGGEFTAASGDDAFHADTELTVTAGNIKVIRSYEGLEANQILIQDGTITIESADDGINAFGGKGWGSKHPTDEMPNLRITGGTVSIQADGDGLDSNGNLVIEGGVIRVDGPTNGWNGAIDSGSENGGVCVVNGRTVIAVGSSGMAEMFDESSKQCSFRHNFDSAFAAGSEVTILDKNGTVLFSYTMAKEASSVVFSRPELVQGETYVLEIEGNRTDITLDVAAVSSGRPVRHFR